MIKKARRIQYLLFVHRPQRVLRESLKNPVRRQKRTAPYNDQGLSGTSPMACVPFTRQKQVLVHGPRRAPIVVVRGPRADAPTAIRLPRNNPSPGLAKHSDSLAMERMVMTSYSPRVTGRVKVNRRRPSRTKRRSRRSSRMRAAKRNQQRKRRSANPSLKSPRGQRKRWAVSALSEHVLSSPRPLAVDQEAID